MGDRCTGTCCENFTLPYSPLEIQRALEAHQAWEKGDGDGHFLMDDGNKALMPNEVEVIAPMVIHLGFYPTEPGWSPQHHYTCKHFDKATGNCGIYATRPKMCSDFPYGRVCRYATCQWDAGRAGLHPPPDPNLQAAIDGCKAVEAGGELDSTGT